MEQQAKPGDPFEEILLSYTDMCYSVALALTRNPRQAQDLATHVLTRAWLRRHRSDSVKDIKKNLLRELREQFLHHYAGSRRVSEPRLIGKN